MKTTEIRKERGQRLAEARRRADMTAEEVVRRLAVATRGRMDFTTSAFYAWEHGRNLLQDHVADQLAPILGCSVEELLGPPVADVQPAIFDEAEFMMLGGSMTTEPSQEGTSSVAEEMDLEIKLSSRADGTVIRKRNWRVTIDTEKAELVIRPGEGCTAESLMLFQPTADENAPLKGKPDYRDLGALRVPFDPHASADDAHAPVLFLQQVREAIPIFRDELPTREMDTLPALQRLARRKLSKDVQLELADFVEPKTAQRLMALWEESTEEGEHLKHYCRRILPRLPDPFEQRLQETLIQTSLLKNHEKARSVIDQLEEEMGDDPRRIADVAYLSGRNRWYLGIDHDQKSQLPRAIDDLVRSVEFARQTGNEIRMGQAFVYLARIGIEQPDQRERVESITKQDVIQLTDKAKEIGREHHRPDIELLAERLHVIRSFKVGEHQKCIEYGKELLRRIDDAKMTGMDFRSIESNLAVHVGLALRRLKTEPARIEAEQIYLDAISRGRNDSHAGMAQYLVGDIYSDRMMEALQSAVHQQDETLRRRDLDAVEQHRIEAQAWYDRAFAALKHRGDRKALQKSLYRVVWIRAGQHGDQLEQLPEPESSQFVEMSDAAREQYIGRRLIGSTFKDQTRSIPSKLLREILTVQHLSVHQNAETIPQIDIDNYVDNDTLVVLPRNLGTSFMAQVLRRSGDTAEKLDIVGWFALPNYNSEIRPHLQQLQRFARRSTWSHDDLTDFQAHARDCWFTLLDRIETIAPLRSASVRRAIVIAPHDHLDAMVPVEALIEEDKTGRSLLESLGESIVYAGPWGAPSRSASVAVSAHETTVFADTTEWKASASAPGRGRRLDALVRSETRFGTQPLPEPDTNLTSRAVVVVAHSDADGKLRDRVRSWKYDGVQAVFLMFCGSGTYDLISGPFSDGVSLRIRRQLGDDGIVVANRLPISAREALRLLQALERHADGKRPIAAVVSDYMRTRLQDQQIPFGFPWIMI